MSQDPELECLVADMWVTRAAPLRRIRVVMKVESKVPGMPDDSLTSTGHPFTVLSGGEGLSIP
jgi:hypothetical protein